MNRRIEVSRTVEAPAERVFAFLADPARHPELDTSGMLRAAASTGRITAVGTVFTMRMHNQEKGDHAVENHVVVYEPDRAIGWAPAEPGAEPAGHTYVYRLVPDGPDRTTVTQVHDWSRFSHLDALPYLPVVDADGLRASLDRLAAALA